MMQALVLIILVFLVYILSYSISYVTSVTKDVKITDKHIKKLIKNKGNYLIRADLSITMLEFLISTLVVDTYAKPFIELLNINNYLQSYLIVIFTTMIFAYIVTILGKYAPKYIAIKDINKINKYAIYLAIIISEIFLPFTILSNYIHNKLIKKLNKEGVNELKTAEIKKAANISYDQKILNKTERDIILNSVKLNELETKNLIKDINDCIYLKKTSDIKELLELYKEHNYTRFPVVNMRKGNIIGIVNIIDIFNDLTKIRSRNTKITKYIKEPMFLSVNSKLTTIYNRLRTKDEHLAVIYEDNTENTVGIITVEDIVEEII